MTPYELDIIAYGAKVYIYRRADGSVYAEHHDFSRFSCPPLEIVRVHLTPTSTAEDVLGHADVRQAIERHSNPEVAA